jgi:CHASE3 domain sensor protein
MIRKAALQVAAPVLLAFMALNAYLAITHLRQIQKNAALALESSLIQANISKVSEDLTDMETSQRGYLLTEQPEYVQSYTDAKSRIGSHFASLRSGLANRSESERSVESQLESLAGTKQAEMERAISLRQQGYRHRAFLLVGTNEAKDNMNQARGLVSSLASAENSNFARLENARQFISSKALSETVLGNVCLFVLTACLFGLVRYHGQVLERDVARSRQMLGARDSQLEKLTSGLSGQARSDIIAIETNARLLLENYGGFLPRQGHEHAQRIQEATAQLERLRRDLLGEPSPNIDKRAA